MLPNATNQPKSIVKFVYMSPREPLVLTQGCVVVEFEFVTEKALLSKQRY